MKVQTRSLKQWQFFDSKVQVTYMSAAGKRVYTQLRHPPFCPIAPLSAYR